MISQVSKFSSQPIFLVSGNKDLGIMLGLFFIGSKSLHSSNSMLLFKNRAYMDKLKEAKANQENSGRPNSGDKNTKRVAIIWMMALILKLY